MQLAQDRIQPKTGKKFSIFLFETIIEATNLALKNDLFHNFFQNSFHLLIIDFILLFSLISRGPSSYIY